MVPLITGQTAFWFGVGLSLAFIVYALIRRSLAVMGLGVLGMITGSAVQALGSGLIAYVGYVLGVTSTGTFAGGALIFLIKLSIEIIKNPELAPYAAK